MYSSKTAKFGLPKLAHVPYLAKKLHCLLRYDVKILFLKIQSSQLSLVLMVKSSFQTMISHVFMVNAFFIRRWLPHFFTATPPGYRLFKDVIRSLAAKKMDNDDNDL